MLNLSNKCDISGMFSKAGRVSYERYHILHNKSGIMNEPDRPKIASKFTSVIDKMVTFNFLGLKCLPV
jgi:hypothetical protein